MSLLDRILKKRAKRKARAQYAREHRRGQHETECPVCHELKKLRLPQTSHVEPPIK